MSTLRTNALEGMDAKNSITIVAGAGNITTTNVQEGLAKVWINMNCTGTIATRESFNVSGITDNATGNQTVSFSNIMTNNTYCTSQGINDDPGAYGSLNTVEQSNGSNYGDFITTSSFKFRSVQNRSDAYVDVGTIQISMLGDLA